ncbi:MAG: hypothetical protein JHD18_09370, partial [Rhodoferax sp.]|jgi:hypothetical protein|nr:hypothetical protein [Rhodoferax sp.]MBJ7469325.1 hypothetical protein [Rhodoferax sp.]
MTPLAFNSLVPQNLRLRFQLALGALPLACMLLAFIPSYFFAQWLEKLEGVPAQSRLLDHPTGRMWVAAFLAALLLQLLCGYLLGWLLNAWLARRLLGWPIEKIRAVYLHSQVPPAWLKPAAAALAGGRVAIIAVARWELERKAGALRYVLRKGLIAWGLPMYVFMYLVQTLLRGESLELQDALQSALLWLGSGAVLGAVMWWVSEFNYRKLKASLGL